MKTCRKLLSHNITLVIKFVNKKKIQVQNVKMKIYIINMNDVCKIWYLKNELTNGGNVQNNTKYLQQYSILQEIRCHKWPRICWVCSFLIHCQSPSTVVFCKSLFFLFVFLFPLAIVLFGLLQCTASDYHFGIVKVFLRSKFFQFPYCLFPLLCTNIYSNFHSKKIRWAIIIPHHNGHAEITFPPNLATGRWHCLVLQSPHQ